MALQNLEFKQVTNGSYIHYESDSMQLTGDCGVQLTFTGDRNDITVLTSMDGDNFVGVHYEFNVGNLFSKPVRGIIPGMYIKISANTKPASGKILMSE